LQNSIFYRLAQGRRGPITGTRQSHPSPPAGPPAVLARARHRSPPTRSADARAQRHPATQPL